MKQHKTQVSAFRRGYYLWLSYGMQLSGFISAAAWILIPKRYLPVEPGDLSALFSNLVIQYGYAFTFSVALFTAGWALRNIVDQEIYQRLTQWRWLAVLTFFAVVIPAILLLILLCTEMLAAPPELLGSHGGNFSKSGYSHCQALAFQCRWLASSLQAGSRKDRS